MKSSFLTLSEKAEIMARFCVPYSLIFMFWILDMISLNIPYFQDVQPSFMLMVLFYWSIYRPTLIPGLFVFIMGLVLDLVSGFPVGLHALLFVLIQRIITDQRKVFSGQPFWTVLFGYCLVSAFFNLVIYCIFGLVQGEFIALEPVLTTILLGIIFFPFVSLIMHLTHKVLPHEDSKGGARRSNSKLSMGS